MSPINRQNLWLEERPVLTPGWGFSMAIDKVLHHEQSKFQDIKVYETPLFGRVLTLDGVIQLTEKDEAHYHEMMIHVPCMAHPKPERVLIIGGGDGGAAREALKYDSVKEVHLCDLDERVIEVSKEFLPFTACAFNDPRMTVITKDGGVYINDHEGYFDVIAVDSTDPEEASSVLFEEPFFASMKRALRPGGIIVSQAEHYHFEKEWDYVKRIFTFSKKLFKNRGYYTTQVPTYPCGMISFTFLSDEAQPKMGANLGSGGKRQPPEGLQYYTLDIHKAAFAIPARAERDLAAI